MQETGSEQGENAASAMSPEAMNERFAISPFSRWLGLHAIECASGRVRIEMPWRAEIAGTPGRLNAHGGVLAALIDTGGSYAIATRTGHPVPTIDLHVDYHRPVSAETLCIEGRIVRLGKRMATAETAITTRDGKLIATGRGLYTVERVGPPASDLER
jgi:uncharacterized protein (TIGR00369 family)